MQPQSEERNGGMIYLVYLARPRVGTEAGAKYAGAAVGCYLDLASVGEAKRRARELIREWVGGGEVEFGGGYYGGEGGGVEGE